MKSSASRIPPAAAAALLLALSACGGSATDAGFPGSIGTHPGSPGAPTAVSATAGNRSASVTWTAPASDGGSPVTGYVVVVHPATPSATPVVTGTSASVGGLANGTTYTFTVIAGNAAGTGPESAPSNPVTPAGPPAPPGTTAPTAPGTPVAVVGVRSASLTWNAPASDGGSPLTGYTVLVSPAAPSAVFAVSGTTASVTGLANGTRYVFRITAENAAGTSPPSDPSAAVTTPDLPSPPAAVSASAGNQSASVSWTPSATDGGSPLTGYTVLVSPPAPLAVVTVSGLAASVTGLVNGTAYTFAVTATNAVGTSAPSVPSAPVTPVAPPGTPGAPTAVLATAGNGSASLSWSAPASDGGSPITSYSVLLTPAAPAAVVSIAGTTATITGLANGTSYVFRVVAANAIGAGPASAPSSPVTPAAPATPPGAPTGVLATAGVRSANLSWNAPASDGGSPVTGYAVAISPATPSALVATSGTTASVTGLANGTAYTFTVSATNAVGAGPSSAPSAAVTTPGAPSAPSAVVATGGNQSATLGWAAPASNGGSPITGYAVAINPPAPAAFVSVTATGATVTGLANGTSYTFTVTASNAAGTGPSSAPSNAVTPAAPPGAPGAPLAVTATAGIRSASVSWTAPASDGGSPITGYTILLSPSTPGAAVVVSGTSASVTGLANGTSYSFIVTATNAVGAGPASAPSAAVSTPNVPAAPTAVAATAGNQSATLTWTAPSSNGGSAVTGYAVTVSPGAASAVVNVAGTSASVSGLVNGTSYTFTVAATNAVGTGAASAPSAPVVPATVPGAPSAVLATAGVRSATVSWTAPSSNGGSPLTGYTVLVAPAAPSAVFTVIGTSASITGLANGTSYTFTVTATNALGTGPASPPSAAVSTPSVPTAPLSVVATAGNQSASVTWTPPASNGGSAITAYAVSVSPAAPGAVISVSGTTASITGLANGTAYGFTVAAINAVGTGPASIVSALVTPAGAPSAPVGVLATASSRSASLTWSAPASNGGSPITSYSVLVSPAAPTAVVTVLGTTASVTGLTNGTTYTFTVTAANAAGTGPASAPSNAVTPLGPPPAISAVGPASGTSAGGTAVTITGTGLVPGPGGTVVSFGGSAAVVTGGTATALAVTTPAHGAGIQDVTVTNPDGQAATLPGAFTYVDPPPSTAPVVSSVSPASGPGVGGTVVTITGLGFGTPVTVQFGGAAATVSSQSSTSIDVITPAHALGVVDVVVTNPDSQAATRASAFQYVFPADPPPTVTSAAPSQGPAAGGTQVTLAGSGFVAPVAVSFGTSPATVVGVTPTAVTVLAPAQAAGTVSIVVTNADTQTATLVSGFTYTAAPVVPPPTLTSVAPASGPAAGGTTLALSGADFDAQASVTIGGLPATVVSRTASTLTVTSPAHAAGAVDVSVLNGSGKSASLPAAFTYVAPPVVTGVTPPSGPTSGGTSITIAGTGFVPGPGGSQVTVGGAAATVTSATTLTLVATTAAHPAGPQPVTVVNPDGQASTLAAAFTFVDPPPAPSAPTITGISPSSGPAAGGTTVTITGSNFVTGGIVTFGGVAATVVGPVLAGQITVTTPINQPPGLVDVTFLNPFSNQVASVPLAYTFVAPPPVIDAVSNRGSPPAGGITMSLTGTGFQPGITATFGGAPATGLVLSDSTPPRKLLTLTVPPQPPGAGAFVDVVLQNPDGQTATYAGFHYGPPPVIASVSVAAPATLTTVHKGDLITITGQDFSVATGVQVSIGQIAVINSATPTQLVVVAPKNNPGTYTVVVVNTDGQTGVGPPGSSIVYPGP